MKYLLKLEELFLFFLALFLFLPLPYAWWWFAILFLAPDLGMLGYLINPRVGAVAYNLTHHKTIAVSLYILGAVVGNPLPQLIGLIILAHSSFDRVLGYGLKYPDSFKHTHLGWIGKQSA